MATHHGLYLHVYLLQWFFFHFPQFLICITFRRMKKKNNNLNVNDIQE